MSRIPRLSNIGGRPSLAANMQQPLKQANVIKGGMKPRISNITPSRNKTAETIFKEQPTLDLMKVRKMPSEITEKSKIIGNSVQLDILFSYVRQQAQNIFSIKFFGMLFPSALSTKKNIMMEKYSILNPHTKIPNKRAVNVASDIENKTVELDLAPVFEQLKMLLKSHKTMKQIVSLTDLLLIYSSIIIFVCENDDNVQQALFFLKTFLQLEIPERQKEASILFSSLISCKDAPPAIRGHAAVVLSLLAKYDHNTLPRVQAGCQHNDQKLAAFCQDAYNRISDSDITTETQQLPPGPVFTPIPDDASLDTVVLLLDSYLNGMENSNLPENPIQFMRNVLLSMEKFNDAIPVLEKGARCLTNSIQIFQTIPVEIVGEMINFCFSILSGESFLKGSDAFNAVEAIQQLSNSIFDQINCDILLTGVAAAVSQIPASGLNLLIDKLKEYLNFSDANIKPRQIEEIKKALSAFHPHYDNQLSFLSSYSDPYDKLSESITKLLDAETVFEEMEEIVKLNDDGLLLQYPLYLRGFLQRAFVIYNNREPMEMDEVQKIIAQDILEKYQNLTEEDLESGPYSVAELEQQYHDLKSQHVTAW